jgi:signal recognition particle subunit SRP54
MQKMGGLGALAGMLPGLKQAQAAMASGKMDDRALLRLDAMISSMTPKERLKPEIINAKRKIRIANGAGTTVQEVNKLLKMHQQMAGAMKKIKKMGGMKGLGALFGKGGMGGGMGGLGDMLGGGMPGMPGGMGSGGGGMPGLPPGFEKFLKK